MDSLDRQEEVVIASNHDRHHVLNHNDNLLNMIVKAAMVLTVLSFLSGLAICRKIWKAKSTVDIEPAPFLAGSAATFLWLRYGLMIQDDNMVAVNCLGVTIFSIYTLFYYFMTKKHRSRVGGKILLTLATVILVVVASFMSSDPIFFGGIFADLSTLTFVASPLASVRLVIKNKSVESLPFLLILLTFLVSTLWFTYGVLIDNKFVMLPNALSSLIAGLQLVLFLIYPSGPVGKKFKTKRVGLDSVPFLVESFQDTEDM